MAKSLYEYTIDELLAEVRQRIEQVPSNAGQYSISGSSCACPTGYEYGGCASSGCKRWVRAD